MVGLLLVLLLMGAGAAAVLRDGDAADPGTGAATSTGPQPARAAAVLNQLQGALVAGDAEAAAALAPSGDEAAGRTLAAAARNAQELGLVDLTLVYGRGTSASTDGRWPALVNLGWRIPGVDRRPARTQVRAEFVVDGDRVAISELGGGDRTPVWLAGPVRVKRLGEDAVVAVASSLGAARAEGYLDLVRDALPTVRAAVPDWQGNVAVQVPATAAGVDEMLGKPNGTYAGIAAVTGTADGSGAPGAPVRVVINPEERGVGERIVMTHELAHVAMGAASAPGNLPAWLVEGFAEVVAVSAIAPGQRSTTEIAHLIDTEGAPTGLPRDEQFDPTTARHLRAAYEGARLACEVIVDRAGLVGLRRIYRDLEQDTAIDLALREHADLSERELVRQWRARLAGLPASSD